MKKFGNILWGIVFIAIGLIIALNVLGITHINIFFGGWWTLFIIVPSIIGLFKNDDKTWSLIWLLIGILLLLSARGIMSFAVLGKMIVPGILIIVGLSIIFKDVIHDKVNKKIKELNKDGLEEYAATFSGQKVDLQGDEFKGAKLDAVFGGVEFNIKNANINEDKIIDCSAIFGGIDIFVPSHVNVKVKSTPIFGGVSNKVPFIKGEDVKTIYINAFCLFGGVDIK